MRTVAIIQARMASQRLPGKALMEIGNCAVLRWVLQRTDTIGVEEVVVATGNRESDNPIHRYCHDRGFEVWRGSEDDVLGRYYEAASFYEATHILRVTADCPLLDPELNVRILSELRGTECAYVSIQTESNGLVQEAFTMEALRLAAENATSDHGREHVVPWMLDNLRCGFYVPDFDLGNGRWCVDTQEDLDRLRAMYDKDPQLFERSAAELVGAHVS